MITKRNLKRLEGLLLLISLPDTESKRRTAAMMGLSVDTVAKYISLLEADLGCELVISSRQNCILNSRGKELVNKIRSFYTENLLVNNTSINLSNLKNLRGVFYLKAVAAYGNKRLAAEQLAASVETINLYIDYLEYLLGTRLLHSDNQGSAPTSFGQKILFKFDLLLKSLDYIIKTVEEQKFRIALAHDIQIASNPRAGLTSHDVIVFADDPYLHSDEWDAAIAYSQPANKDLVVVEQKQIPCGFFASREYLNRYGAPKDIADVLQNHRILDGSKRPYADKKYRSFIQSCSKICPINNSNIILSDMARYGTGICIIPLTVTRTDLLYLDYIPCDANATLYLSTHKNIQKIPRFQQAIDNCVQMLTQL